MRQNQAKKTERMPDMRAIKAKAKERFGKLAGVQGFGIGDSVLRVYVKSKASVEDRVPTRFQGVPVNLIVTGDIAARSNKAR